MNLGKNTIKIAMNHLHRNKMESCGDKLNNNDFLSVNKSRDSNIFHDLMFIQHGFIRKIKEG